MTQHPHADILRAIADGEPIQRYLVSGVWETTTGDHAMRAILEGISATIRVKPRTLSINGREFEAPVEKNECSQFPLTIDSHGGFLIRTFWNNTKEARDLHYKILVEESTPK